MPDSEFTSQKLRRAVIKFLEEIDDTDINAISIENSRVAGTTIMTIKVSYRNLDVDVFASD